MIKFNMNNYVWFEPTELGEKVYKDYFTQLGFEEPYNKLKLVNGKACLQFHNFIHIYGDYITSYICKDKAVFKGYEFYIDEGKLVNMQVFGVNMKEDLILESFKQYHNANWHDGDNTFDERTYAKSNGVATSPDADFADPFVQYCFEHYEAGYHSGYEKAYQDQQLVLDEHKHEDYVPTLLNRANILYLEQEIIYLKAENEKIHELLKEIVPTDEIKKRTFNILTEVLCKNCERVFSLCEELCGKQESK